MAYTPLYEFNFRSTNGKDIIIRINAEGYVGSVISRKIGGAPQLRLEQNGNIKGMSLEWPAECVTEDEYASLYTSNPYKYQVDLLIEGTIRWRGFITPELYSAPWIDPPYDVTITATDGLGELKMHTFPALGNQTLEALFATLLGATGLNLPMKAINTAYNDVVAAQYLFPDTTVNINHMAGKTYYEVLDALLTALHATIQQSGTEWLLIRETDVTELTEDGRVYDTSGMSYPIVSFGSMQSNDIWPVGRLRMEIVPAKNSIKVSAANHFPDSISDDPEMILGNWPGDGTHFISDDGFYALARGQAIYYDLTPLPSDFPYLPDTLDIKVKCRKSDFRDANLMICVRAIGTQRHTGQSGYVMSWYVNYGVGYWIGGADGTANIQPGDANYGNAADCTENTITVKLRDLYTYYLSDLSDLKVFLMSDHNTIYVHSCYISMSSVTDGVNTRLVLNNDARGAAPDVEPPFADTYDGNKGLPFMDNAVSGKHANIVYRVERWGSDAIAAVPYGEWLAKDNAFSIATPRLRLQGKLNMPSTQILPPFFCSTGGLTYICETYSFDLLNDEVEVSLITLPASSLQVLSVRQTAYGEDGSELDSSVSVFPASFNMAADDTTTRCYMAIICPSTLSWTVTGLPAWVIMSVEDQSGTGPGTISFLVTANSGDARQAVILVAGVPVSIYQESASGEHSLTLDITPSGASIVMTLDGVEAQYTAGMMVPTGTLVAVTISSPGYSTIIDDFFMPGQDTVKTYSLPQSIEATITPVLASISKDAQNVSYNISDPGNHGWMLDFDGPEAYDRITGAGVTSGNATVSGASISGTGNAVVYLTVPANGNAYTRSIDNTPFYFEDATTHTRTSLAINQLGTQDSEVQVTSISLNKNSTSIAAGESEKLTATISPSNATNKNIAWSSSNPSVAQVGQDGTIYAIASGTCIITASATDGSNKSATCAVTVTGSAQVAVTGVSLNQNSISVPINGTVQLAATVSPSNATNKAVSWRSTAPSIATVNSSGVVTGVAIGACRIYVTTVDGGYEAYCSVTVTNSGTMRADNLTVKSVATSASNPLEASNMQAATMQASCPASWVSGVSVDTSGTTWRVRINMSANTSTTSRSTTVTVTGTDVAGATKTVTFRLTQNARTSSDVPCTSMEIGGSSAINNSGNSAEYTAAYSPSATTQPACVWSLTDGSGNPTSLATLSSNGNLCTITVLPGASNLTLKLKATNYYNGNVYAEKTITATYIAPSDITVSPASVRVNAVDTTDQSPVVTASGIQSGSLAVQSVSGFITSASIINGHLVAVFPQNSGSEDRMGSVVLIALDSGGDPVSATVSYIQAGVPASGNNIAVTALRVEQLGGKVKAQFDLNYRNNSASTTTFPAGTYILTGYDSSDNVTFTRNGSIASRSVAALTTEDEIISEQWTGTLGMTVRYVLQVTVGNMETTYQGDGNDEID